MKRPVLAALFLLGVVLFSFLPEPFKGRFATSGMLHRGVHIAAFAIAFLLVAGVTDAKLARACALAVGLVALAASLEYLQSRVYGNYLEYWDIRDDAAGVAFSFLGWQARALARSISIRHPHREEKKVTFS